MTLPLGVAALDKVLGGGMPARTTMLVHGPSFAGKERLARGAFLAALRQGSPAVFILTNAGAAEMRFELARMEPRYPEWEKAGLAWFIDAYSVAIEDDEPAPCVTYVEGSLDTNGMAVAVNEAQKRFIADHDEHLVVLDSASTLALYTSAQATFRFLQVLTGKCRRAGATNVILLDEGMHRPEEVQMFRHLAHGMIDMAEEDGGQTRLRIHSSALLRDPGWVDYDHDERGLRITGSLAAGRIR